jgi:glycosyltransferase involved in cell wall biosynthesis
MKILLIIPGLSKEFNDNFYSYSHINRLGNPILVITRQKMTAKGAGTLLPLYEEVDGMKIHRILEQRNYQKIFKIVESFKPDIIFCSQQGNMPLGIKLKRDFKIPIVLLVEYAYNPQYPFRLRGLAGKQKITKLKFLGNIVGKMYWLWLCKHSSAVITCNPEDKKHLEELSINGLPVYYIPWPSHPTIDPSKIERDNEKAIYIGAFTAGKNIPEFATTIPKILENTPTKKFIFVGSGKYQYVVEELKRLYPKSIEHILSVTRDEALELIASSYYAYTPVREGGWGFFGDCWSMKTTIIATYNGYELRDRSDCILTTPGKIVQSINELYKDSRLYKKVQEGGYGRFLKNHEAESVGEKYYEVCKLVIGKVN